jgi:hypothetical protein
MNVKYQNSPPLVNSGFVDGRFEPKYATVNAGLNNPVFPLFSTPFQQLLILSTGLKIE